MSSEFINVSAIDRFSSNYTVKSSDTIMINGVEDKAINIKVGDRVAFIDIVGYPVRIASVASVYPTRYVPTCVAGGCFVYGPNKQEVRVNTLRVGDSVLNASDNYVRITHVIKTMVGEEIDMYFNKSSGLKLTGYHPIKNTGNTWVFPAECSMFEKKREWTSAVYSFAVEGGEPIYVNAIVVATLAHHIAGPVIEHLYFGEDAVLRDIERISEDRYAVIQMGQIERDPETGKVSGIREN